MASSSDAAAPRPVGCVETGIAAGNERCPFCQYTHAPDSGWDFCSADMDPTSALAGRHNLIAWLRAAPRAEKEKEMLRVQEEEFGGFGRCDAGGPNFQLALAAGNGLASVDGAPRKKCKYSVKQGLGE